MADSEANILAPRSRVPINQAGIEIWEACIDSIFSAECAEGTNNGTIKLKTFQDKSTSTDLITAKVNFKISKNRTVGGTEKNPKDTVIKKWRERRATAEHERARRAVIDSLKEKFRGTKRQANLDAFGVGDKDYIHRGIPTIAVTEDVEDMSNLNVNRDTGGGGNLDRINHRFKVDSAAVAVAFGCHARKLQMGPGGELAQWRLATRGSWAAGAEGGLRGIVREVMPVSSNKAHTIIRCFTLYSSFLTAARIVGISMTT